MITRRLRKIRKGQAIVELALLFPFFLLIIVGGIIDFGFAFYNFVTLQQIANDTARYGAEGNGTSGVSDSNILSFANSKKPSWWSGTYSPSVSRVSISGATVIRVVISYQTPVYTPFYQTLLGSFTSNTFIPLSVVAAYQIPNQVASR
ncbi:pilus assembly protein [bacterium]|nr:pilus assembly protein [bacterium]